MFFSISHIILFRLLVITGTALFFTMMFAFVGLYTRKLNLLLPNILIVVSWYTYDYWFLLHLYDLVVRSLGQFVYTLLSSRWLCSLVYLYSPNCCSDCVMVYTMDCLSRLRQREEKRGIEEFANELKTLVLFYKKKHIMKYMLWFWDERFCYVRWYRKPQTFSFDVMTSSRFRLSLWSSWRKFFSKPD